MSNPRREAAAAAKHLVVSPVLKQLGYHRTTNSADSVRHEGVLWSAILFGELRNIWLEVKIEQKSG